MQQLNQYRPVWQGVGQALMWVALANNLAFQIADLQTLSTLVLLGGCLLTWWATGWAGWRRSTAPGEVLVALPLAALLIWAWWISAPTPALGWLILGLGLGHGLLLARRARSPVQG